VITGKRSILSALQKSFGALAPEERRDAGAELQEARRVVESALESRRHELSQRARAQVLLEDGLDLGDVVVRDVRWPASVGHPSLVALTQRELEDVFVAMGFTVAESPRVPRSRATGTTSRPSISPRRTRRGVCGTPSTSNSAKRKRWSFAPIRRRRRFI
jgi:phenylalanyl-tRNA synthetase alpha chain